MANINIRKFNPKKIENNRIILFIGKRNTGKSTLVRDIMWHHRDIPVGVVMSPTEESNEFYKEMVPDSYIYGDYDASAIDSIIKRQKKCIREKKKENVFILMDDCMYDGKKITKDVNMRGIFMNGRHWGILCMITMQYCMDLSPDLRANIDYLFVLRENILSNKEKIYKNFFGIFPSFDVFNQVMDKCTENFECLVLDNTSRSNKIEETVYWYKADVHKPFRMCAPYVWNHHTRAYKKDYDITKDEDISKDKKSKPSVKVTKKKS